MRNIAQETKKIKCRIADHKQLASEVCNQKICNEQSFYFMQVLDSAKYMFQKCQYKENIIYQFMQCNLEEALSGIFLGINNCAKNNFYQDPIYLIRLCIASKNTITPEMQSEMKDKLVKKENPLNSDDIVTIVNLQRLFDDFFSNHVKVLSITKGDVEHTAKKGNIFLITLYEILNAYFYFFQKQKGQNGGTDGT